MKIGTLTVENIERISPVVGDFAFAKKDEGGMCHSGYYFTISFYDKKDITIKLTGDDVFGVGWYATDERNCVHFMPFDEDFYKTRLAVVLDKISRFRKELEEMWLANESDIPTFNLKDY